MTSNDQKNHLIAQLMNYIDAEHPVKKKIQNYCHSYFKEGLLGVPPDRDIIKQTLEKTLKEIHYIYRHNPDPSLGDLYNFTFRICNTLY